LARRFCLLAADLPFARKNPPGSRGTCRASSGAPLRIARMENNYFAGTGVSRQRDRGVSFATPPEFHFLV